MEFALFNTETAEGWEAWNRRNVEVRDGSVSLAREPVVEETPLGIEAVDVAIDSCGVLYILDPDGDLYTYDPDRETFDRLPCVGVDDPRALCVTRENVYVVGGDPGRLHALSKELLQTKWITDPRFGAPVELAAAGGSVLVLGADPESDARSLTIVGSDGEVQTVVDGDEFATAIDLATDRAETGYVLARSDGRPVIWQFDTADAASADEFVSEFRVLGTSATVDPSCLAVAPDGELVVGTDSAIVEATLFRYLPAESGFEKLPGFERGCRSLLFGQQDASELGGSFYAVAQGGTAQDGTSAQGGDGAVFLLTAGWRNSHTDDWLARTRVSRALDRAEGSGDDESEANESGDNESEGDGSGDDGSVRPDTNYEGELIRRFDSGSRGIRWHRVKTGLNVQGPNRQISLSYYASDRRAAPDALEALSEAVRDLDSTHVEQLRDAGVEGAWDLIERGPEAVAEHVSDASNDRATAWHEQALDLLVEREDWRPLGRPHPEDALLESAEGRYLHVKLAVVGSEYASPRIDSFRVYFPRQSYLRYLPAIYREDEASAAFLERFLSLFESTFVDVEEGIEDVTRHLDPRGVPSEYLSWLEGWLAVQADETWPEPARREFLSNAPALFKKRGTREGLLEMLRIYLDHVEVSPDSQVRLSPLDANPSADPDRTLISLLERPDLDCIDDDATYDAYARLLGGPASFLVLVHPLADDQLRTVERIVEWSTPAHVTGEVVQLRPRFELGRNAYLGVNSAIPKRGVVLGRSALDRSARLVEREPYAQLELHSRLGKDTRLS